MASSLSPSSPLFFPPPPKRTSTPIQSSSLPSPKPRTRRKNHLRPKLPSKTLNPSPLEPPQPLSLQDLDSIQESPIETPLLFAINEVESVEESVFSTETLNPSPSSGHRWLPSPVLDLSLRFAALLAVQTAAAVWILGGGGKVEEGRSSRISKEVVKENREESLEFERMVLEIRGMAREAREMESRKIGEENGVKGEVGLRLGVSRKSSLKVLLDEKVPPLKDLGGEKSSSRRRQRGLVKLNAKKRSAARGFNTVKRRVEGGDGAVNSGGVQQISRQNHVKDSPSLSEPTESSAASSGPAKTLSDAEDSAVLPSEKSLNVNELHIAPQTTVERLESGLETSALGSNSRRREARLEQSFKEGSQFLSTISSDVDGRSDSNSQSQEAESPSITNKYEDGTFNQGNKPWWLKLPFVLAILLGRGSERSSPKGLYSLKIDSPSDGGSTSYTIVFQDQGDATNFCYLLESFFEDLGDCTADVVPLTIKELEEEMSSNALKVIVVKKRQLRLYAGQPLAEVEAELRCLLD